MTYIIDNVSHEKIRKILGDDSFIEKLLDCLEVNKLDIEDLQDEVSFLENKIKELESQLEAKKFQWEK
jgi:phage terminase large subunit-like protein